MGEIFANFQKLENFRIFQTKKARKFKFFVIFRVRLLAKVEKLSHRKWRNIFCGIISIAPDCFCKQPFNADYTTDNVSMGMFFHFDGKYGVY